MAELFSHILIHNESSWYNVLIMRAVNENQAPTRVCVTLTPEIRQEINAKAQDTGLSLNRTILPLLRAGLEAERQKKEHLDQLLRQYRESSDPKEVERLGEELGALIFGG